jgi:nucleoside-diphosphate-sugar epimerase
MARRSKVSRHQTVLVTGASGFLGYKVCRTLIESGTTVRGLTRSLPGPDLRDMPCYRLADLSQVHQLPEAFRGVDVIVHLAALAHSPRDSGWDSLPRYRAANVEGTRAVAEAARAAGVRRFIFASSIKVMGPSIGRPWTEKDQPKPTDPYAQSKLEAEMVLQSFAEDAGLELAILRMPLVYGPGVKANMRQLYSLVHRGTPLPLRSVTNRRSLLYSGNAAEVILMLISQPDIGREVFFVSDGQSVSTPDLVEAIATSLRTRARLFPFPIWALEALGKAGDAINRLVQSPVTSDLIGRLIGSLECASEKLTRVYRYNPRYSLQQGLDDTAAWYLSQT